MFWQVELTSVLLHVNFAFHSTKSCQQPLWKLLSPSLRFISINYLQYSSPAVSALSTKFQICFFAIRLGPSAFCRFTKVKMFQAFIFPTHSYNRVQPALISCHLFIFSLQKQKCAPKLLAKNLLGHFLNKFNPFVHGDLVTHSLYSSKCGYWVGTLKSFLMGNHAIVEPGGTVSVQSDAAWPSATVI